MKNAFEKAFIDTIKIIHVSFPEEALAWWFRQLSDNDYRRLVRGGKKAGIREGQKYLRFSEKDVTYE
jgi:hypothetical protein